jgi:hypothetical protein
MTMTKSESKSPPQHRTDSKGSGKETKVYRSVAEIRRAFYPKAGSETAKARARASHELLRTSRDGAL